MADGAVLVTGAGRGIGRAIAVELAAARRPVAVNYRSNADEAKETRRLVEAAGGEALCVQADVSDPDGVAGLFRAVRSELGEVVVLVNNAGIRNDGLTLSMSDDAWRSVVDTNLYGAFACTRAALKGMLRARFGRIVNVASVAGIAGSPGQANYSAAKAGLVGLTRTVAREVAAKGITVNAVAPGPVATDLTEDLAGPRWDRLLAQVPAGRAATPAEVAHVVAFLCSDRAAYVTGAVIPIDGGMTA